MRDGPNLAFQVRAMLINSARTLGGSVDVYIPAVRPPCSSDAACPAWVQVKCRLHHMQRCKATGMKHHMCMVCSEAVCPEWVQVLLILQVFA